MRLLLSIALAIWVALPSTALAQSAPDFEQFDTFASSVEKVIENDRLSDEGFQDLRDSLTRWRANFLDAQDTNKVQVEALEAQIEALGPIPGEGETEPASIAERRVALDAALQEALAPRISAEEAYARADALIRQIDATIRGRQADAFFQLDRTPLDPSLWAGAIAKLGEVMSDVRTEIASNFAAIPDRSTIWQRIAIAVLLLGGSVFLVFRGPRLIEHWLARIETRSDEHGSVLYGFLLSFGSVLMAMAGVSLFNVALISTGILGDTGRSLAIGINTAILMFAVARWLGGRLFPQRGSIPSPLILDERQKARARTASTSVGLLTGLLVILGILNLTVNFGTAKLGVLALPVMILLGLSMFRLGGLIHAGGQSVEGSETHFADRVERLLGRAVQLVAIVGSIAAVIGFQNLAGGLLVPTAISLGFLAFLASLHFALRAGYGLLRGLDSTGAKQALAPVLATFVLALGSVPFLALIWGARGSDLGEAWTRFTEGIPLGESSISPGDLLTFAVVFAIGYGLTRLVQGTLRTSVLPRTSLDKGGRNAIVSGLGYLGVTIAAVAGITAAGIDLSSFAIIIGALGVGIGFGLQNIVNNFVSGIILLIERPISEGDWVEVNGKMGIVKAISVRSTRIETFDRTDVIVPNGDLISGTVTNWTRGDSVGRIIVPVGVAYGTDTRKVEGILSEIAQAHPIVALNPPPAVVFRGFGADSMDFEIRAILSDINFGLSATSDINHEIARRFAEEGIEIPFAQRDVWLRNPESLTPSSQGPRPPSGPLDPALGALDPDGDSA
ncbi:MAG: mechanosensitive ion channel family protein [Silicimonas sp.]|nr:mechanosensitive ion channel family protein [Silicimonas sp.]